MPPEHGFTIAHNSFKNLSRRNYFGKNIENVVTGSVEAAFCEGLDFTLIYPPWPVMISLAR